MKPIPIWMTHAQTISVKSARRPRIESVVASSIGVMKYRP